MRLWPHRPSQSNLLGHLPDNISAGACRYLCSPVFSIRARQAVLTGSAAQTVALAMVITVAATAVPAIPVKQRTGMRYITFKLPDMSGFPGPWSDIRTMLSPVICQHVGQVAGIAVIRILLCRSGPGEATITVKGNDRFGIYIVLLLNARRHAGVSRPAMGSVEVRMSGQLCASGR